MQTIALPKKISFEKSKDQNKGKMIIEPCYPGYGTTLGNAVRRVLLSSLPGSAVVGVKIKGVSHEFMALSNLKEDILEFILNLKKIRLKMFVDEPVKLTLKVHGKKEITAGDIEKNSSVEIVNPELVIGNITNMGGTIEAEITVASGMGYETTENREKTNNEVGYIEIDSIFTPVISVGINIENVRVGKMINWDKLSLDILTDGTITPEEAFNDSVKILIDQFTALAPENEDKKEKKEEEKTKKDK